MGRDGHSEIDVTSPGITSGPPAKGGWAQNAFWRNNAWEVRSGFGQVGQWDTSLSAVRPNRLTSGLADFGLSKQLGCYVIDKTAFGHTQVVSVWKAYGFTSKSPIRGRFQSVYVVFIYDVDTGVMWEEIVYSHTSQISVDGSVGNANGNMYWSKIVKSPYNMSQWRANYETSADEDYQSWSSADDTDWWFTWFGDSLFMGADGVPPLVYSPVDPWKSRGKQCTRGLGKELSPKYGESSTLSWAGPVPGPLVDVNPYISASEFPSFSSAVTFGNHIAASRGKDILFSYAGKPFVFIADLISIPDAVTAMAPLGNALLIFSETKTFMYQPGGRVSTGQLIALSESIGCSGNGATCQMGRTGTSVAWVDKRGIHVTSGNFQIDTISGPVDNFFSSFLENPLTTYFVASGKASVSSDSQPRSVSRFDSDGVNICYVPHLDILLATFPNENTSLCFSEGRWSLWTSSTNATGPTEASATENIVRPFYGASDVDLFLMGGVAAANVVDASKWGGMSDVRADLTLRSAYLLRYGRGGAIDRSVRYEDYRGGSLYMMTPFPASEFSLKYKSTAQGLLLMDDPIEMPVGYQFFYSNNAASHTVASDKKTILVPIKVAISQLFDGTTGAVIYGVDEIHIEFDFDNVHWEPVFLTGEKIFPVFPSERLSSYPGWDEDIAGSSEMKCYLSSSPDADGNSIHLHFDPANAPVPSGQQWAHYPRLNLPAEQFATLMYLPFVQKTADLADSVGGLGIASASFTYRNTNPTGTASSPLVSGSVSVNNKMFIGTDVKVAQDSVAQPVDWAVKSEPFALQEGMLVQGRGVFILIENKGLAKTDNQLVSDNPSGFINLISAADGKEWVGQIIDTDTLNPVPALNNTVNKQSVLERVEGATTVSRALYEESGEVTYGDSAIPATGTYICGSAEVDIIQVSESQKGQSISWMLYGHMRARGQGLRVQSVKAEVTKVGERRRYGR